jgi:hypothetical protein
MTAFRLRCFDSNADRISVQSTVNATWAPERRHSASMQPTEHEVYLVRDEVLIIKTRGDNVIELMGLPDSADGLPIVRSSRRATFTLRPDKPVVLEMEDGEALIVRSEHAHDPTRAHRTDVTV